MNLKLRLGYEFGSRINRVGGIGWWKQKYCYSFIIEKLQWLNTYSSPYQVTEILILDISTYEDFKKQPVF